MKKQLEDKYAELQKICGCITQNDFKRINEIIKQAICGFMKTCNNPAIWCYGEHTKMLMADFIFELKSVKYIIDNGAKEHGESGFKIINSQEIEKKEIDGIIISSYLYKQEIAEEIQTNHKQIPYLDLYEVLEKEGIVFDDAYYVAVHPYKKYCKINKKQINILNKSKNCELELEEVIRRYVDIKDFKSAIKYAELLVEYNPKGEWGIQVLELLRDIYALQFKSMEMINDNNVLMLCVDGLRRQEVCEKCMPKLYDFLCKNTYYCSNAYSVSTSTYESLIPTYSENDDLRTEYYRSNVVPQGKCRFINEAKKQGRRIFFYTDGTKYIDEEEIAVTTYSQTATEKMWDFLLDAADEKNGLFYVHLLYESHYSYPNPYTKEKILAEGSSILFDYLDENGGSIRINYKQQQQDALKYLDDVIVPLVEKLKCRMVVYADHGNILIDQGVNLEEIEKNKFTYHEDWIQVPLAIKAPEMKVKEEHAISSIISLNEIIIKLLNKQEFSFPKREYIKVVRSEIYNPNFLLVYEKANKQYERLAFEAFLFQEGYKLGIYSDGTVELHTNGDEELRDVRLKEELLKKVKKDITVCEIA